MFCLVVFRPCLQRLQFCCPTLTTHSVQAASPTKCCQRFVVQANVVFGRCCRLLPSPGQPQHSAHTRATGLWTGMGLVCSGVLLLAASWVGCKIVSEQKILLMKHQGSWWICSNLGVTVSIGPFICLACPSSSLCCHRPALCQ